MVTARIIRTVKGLPAFRSLHHRNYRLFFTGQIFSLIGTWMQNVAQAWLIYQLTHSSVWLGTIGFLNSIPLLFFSMFGGTLADRMSKHRMVIATQALRAVQALLLAGLFFLGWITPTAVAVAAFLLGIINAFDIPTRQSFIVDLVGKEDLANAIALNSATFNAARMIGPAVGGILIGYVGIGWCFFLNAVSFLAVIIGLLMMKVNNPREPDLYGRSVFQSIRDSVSYIRSDRTLKTLMFLVGVVTIFGWSYSVLLPVFADTVLNIGVVGLGNLYTATGVGAFFSAMTIASVESKVHPRKFVYSGIAIFVVSISIFALSPNYTLSLVSLIGAGMGLVAFFATVNASIQRRSPDHLRGRVMGFYSLVFQGLFPFGSFGIGILAHQIGVQAAVGCGACVCAVAGISGYSIMTRKRELR